MPVNMNADEYQQAQAISRSQGVPLDYALLVVRGNAPDASPQAFQEMVQANPYSKENLPPDDGVPFNAGPEVLAGGLEGAPGADMGIDPMAGTGPNGNPLLSDGEEGYGHLQDNSYDAGLQRGVLKQRNDQAKADQGLEDQMNVLGEARQRDIDNSVELGMLPQQGYANLVEQDPDFVGHRVEQVASPTADDPDRTVPVTRVHGGKQMTHDEESFDIAGHEGYYTPDGNRFRDLDSQADSGTPAYDYIPVLKENPDTGDMEETYINPTLMKKQLYRNNDDGSALTDGALNAHQMKQLQTRMNRKRDASGYSDETQYTPYRKMDGSMGLRIDPNSPEVRQKRRDQVADQASRQQLLKARGMLAGVSPTQNMVNAQMLLMGNELPGGVNMSEDFRRRTMQQMNPESTKFDIAKAEQEGLSKRARIEGRTDRDVEETRAGGVTTVAEVKANADKEIAELQRDALEIKTDEDRAQAQRNHEEKIQESKTRERRLIAEEKYREAEAERRHQETLQQGALQLETVRTTQRQTQADIDDRKAINDRAEADRNPLQVGSTEIANGTFNSTSAMAYRDRQYETFNRSQQAGLTLDEENAYRKHFYELGVPPDQIETMLREDEQRNSFWNQGRVNSPQPTYVSP